MIQLVFNQDFNGQNHLFQRFLLYIAVFIAELYEDFALIEGINRVTLLVLDFIDSLPYLDDLQWRISLLL